MEEEMRECMCIWMIADGYQNLALPSIVRSITVVISTASPDHKWITSIARIGLEEEP